MRTKLNELAELGQSVWLDYIHRSLINSGGLRGVTSNPTIFADAITKSDVYDDQTMKPLSTRLSWKLMKLRSFEYFAKWA